MYDFYLKILDILMAIAEHYNKINYFYYRLIFRGTDSIEDFYLTEINVGLWILILFSIGVCFALIFIPLSDSNMEMRKQRKRIKAIMPLGIILAPTPAILVFIWEIISVVKWIIRKIKQILNKY